MGSAEKPAYLDDDEDEEGAPSLLGESVEVDSLDVELDSSRRPKLPFTGAAVSVDTPERIPDIGLMLASVVDGVIVKSNEKQKKVECNVTELVGQIDPENVESAFRADFH